MSDVPETQVVLRAIKEVNLPKFVAQVNIFVYIWAFSHLKHKMIRSWYVISTWYFISLLQDVPLFEGIVQDLFPSEKDTTITIDPALMTAIKKTLEENNLQVRHLFFT